MKNDNWKSIRPLVELLYEKYRINKGDINKKTGIVTITCITNAFSGYVFTFSTFDQVTVECVYFHTTFNDREIFVKNIFFVNAQATELMGYENLLDPFRILLNLCSEI